MSCSSPDRLPRSLHESPAYNPEWRHLQVLEYLRCRRHQDDQDGTYILPTSERDALVRAYFKFRSGVIGSNYAAFRYAQDCDDTNDRTWMGSRIKAMTVAGIAAAEIARRLHTSTENIEMFQKLFFDIAACQGDPVTLGAILAPMLIPDSPVNQRERLWLLAALKLGTKGLDYVLDQKVKLSAAEQKEISESIHTILAEQSLAYTLSLQLKGEPTGDVLDHYQKSVEARLRSPEVDDSKMEIYRANVMQAARAKFAEKAARRAVGPPAAEAPSSP